MGTDSGGRGRPRKSPRQVLADTFDVVVLGAGPGGYVAAIRAAQHGLRVGVVEREKVGGVCLNRGCIPTKAMLHGADVLHQIASAPGMGITVDGVTLDIAGVETFTESVVARLVGGVEGLLAANGVEVVAGSARVVAKGEVEVTHEGATRTLRCAHLILATGARPKSIPGVEPDGGRIWTSTDALRPQTLPTSLLVIGSGAIGAEFASLYRDFGVEVTLVEALPRILPVEDAEVSAFVERQFRSRGIDVATGVRISSVAAGPDAVRTVLVGATGQERVLETERVLVATGVAPNSQGLGLAELGVRVDARGFVETDQWCRTTVAGIYAIGDVAGAPCLAHKASEEGVLCVDHLAGAAGVTPLDRDWVPGCTYSRPQVASIGFTEEQARARGFDVRVGRFDLSGNGKVLAMGEDAGFVKTLFDADSGHLLGAHMVGPEVVEMVQGFGIAHRLDATAQDLAEVVFPHPSVSEAMHESVLDALDRVIHWPPRERPRGGIAAVVA